MITHINYNGGKQVSYQYDAVGALVEMNDWTGKTSFEVDLLNRIIKTTDTKGRAVEYDYDEVGNQTSIKYPDNTTVTKTYDLLSQIKTVTEDDVRTTTYTYDALHRITSVKENYGNKTRSYTYDSLGNLTYETSQGNKSVDYKLNNLNQITVNPMIDGKPLPPIPMIKEEI